MPSPPHPCAHLGCTAMLPRKESIHCKKHVPRTKEWIERQAQSNAGKKRSEKTKKLISKSKRGKGSIDRKCKNCGLTFKVSKPSKKTRFCSRDCGYNNRRGDLAKNWKGGPIKLICTVCGSEYLRKKALSEKSSTCSFGCNGVRAQRLQKNKRTKIEIMMAESLRLSKVKFIEQFESPAKCIPDFYLPKYNAVIFCDGEYWHSMKRNIRRDITNSDKLIKLGFTVFRFTEGDIMFDSDGCVRRFLSCFSSYS